MEVTNRICPYCGKGNVWYLRQDERVNSNDLYCRSCFMRFSDIDVTAVEIKGNIQEQDAVTVHDPGAFCPKCGWMLYPEDHPKFCGNCGYPVKWE